MTLRVEPIPKTEGGEGDEADDGNFCRIRAQPFAEAIAAPVQGPPGEPDRARKHESEGLVEQRRADHQSESQNRAPADAGLVARLQQEHAKRQEEPESFRSGREKDAAVAIGAEKREVDERGKQCGRGVRRDFARDEKNHQRCGQSVEDAGPAKVPKRPVLRPVCADQSLPEKSGWLGVAVPLDHGLQRKPVPGLRRGVGHLRIEQFIAIGRGMVAAEGREIGGQGEDDAKKGGQSGVADGFGRHRRRIGD